MGEENHIPVEGKGANTSSRYIVRDSQAAILVTLVALGGIFGGFWTYHNSERNAQAAALALVEARYQREIDQLGKRIDEMDRRWEQRLVWVEREVKK